MATVRLYRSTTAGNVPASLVSGQVAINEADGKLFYRNGSGVVTQLATGGSGGVSSVAGRTGAVTLTSADVSGVAASSATGITGATAITNIVSLTQSSYDALGSKIATTLYIING